MEKVKQQTVFYLETSPIKAELLKGEIAKKLKTMKVTDADITLMFSSTPIEGKRLEEGKVPFITYIMKSDEMYRFKYKEIMSELATFIREKSQVKTVMQFDKTLKSDTPEEFLAIPKECAQNIVYNYAWLNKA